MSRNYFEELNVDCFDLDAFYIKNYPEVFECIKYVSDYSKALNFLACHFIESKLDRNLITK